MQKILWVIGILLGVTILIDSIHNYNTGTNTVFYGLKIVSVIVVLITFVYLLLKKSK